MAASNGNGRASEMRIELVTPTAGAGEAAAIVAALEQFLADTTPPAAPERPAMSSWQRASLEEGIAARQLHGDVWGHAPRHP